jgi:3-methylfumaryl-CoA hydratase
MALIHDEPLIGRVAYTADNVDAHRWNAYRRYFQLTDAELPLALHWLMFNSLPERTRPDGHAVEMIPFPALPYPRRMWAGGEVRWLSPLTANGPITRKTTLSRADTKQGSAGSFLLAALTHDIADLENQIIEERQDIVFLPAVAKPAAAAIKAPSFASEWEENLSFGSIDLFRYSALTLNSHRIHYDETFAKDVECYPGLVVHGPLLATHLMHAGARRYQGRQPAHFAYRAVAPLFAEQNAKIVGRSNGNIVDLAILGPDGGVRTTASMTFMDDAT